MAQSVYDCDGKLPVRDLADHFGLELEPEGYETVAGLVLTLAGRIPVAGARFRFADLEVEVLEVTRRRVAKVRFRVATGSEEK